MADANSLPSGLPQIRPTRWFIHPRSQSELLAVLEARLRTLEFAHDARAIWCRALLLVARDDGAPPDPWYRDVALEAAQHYLRAVDSWDRGELSLVPSPWRCIFARERHQPPAVDDALHAALGVHIAYDWPLAIARIGPPPNQSAAREAFDTATASLSSIIAPIRRDLRRRYGGRAALLRLIEEPWSAHISPAQIRSLRHRAWDDGYALLAAAHDDDALSAVFSRVEVRALRLAAPASPRHATPARVRAEVPGTGRFV
jgi:hypothetical protein